MITRFIYIRPIIAGVQNAGLFFLGSGTRLVFNIYDDGNGRDEESSLFVCAHICCTYDCAAAYYWGLAVGLLGQVGGRAFRRARFVLGGRSSGAHLGVDAYKIYYGHYHRLC